MPYSSFIVGLELAGGVSLHGSMSSWPAEHDMDGRASKTESPGILWLKSCGPSLCLTAFRGGLLQMPHALVAGPAILGLMTPQTAGKQAAQTKSQRSTMMPAGPDIRTGDLLFPCPTQTAARLCPEVRILKKQNDR